MLILNDTELKILKDTIKFRLKNDTDNDRAEEVKVMMKVLSSINKVLKRDIKYTVGKEL